jgi:hypothetical protein
MMSKWKSSITQGVVRVWTEENEEKFLHGMGIDLHMISVFKN